jgi:hypothetical protein
MERSGIVFFKTHRLDDLKRFYLDEVGCSLWMDQGDCCILSHGVFLFGFCTRATQDLGGIITFVFQQEAEVDALYQQFSAIADGPPRMNPRYPIYHFFATDPEGRTIEFQVFH